ncbi:DUF4352 domain-containing protein [Peribacillus asahii]|uniref:DUF4352 domain-containing protein n=1 Tax=Peribacillus asahii TaxID=228899 RepID=UPI00380A5BBA
MKKLLGLSIIFILLFALAACSSSEDTSSQEKAKKDESNGKLLTKEEFNKMYSDPKKYKGSKVDFYAKVFIEPEKDDDGTYLQVYADNNEERNTIVGIEDPDLEVKVDDIIHVVGTVKDVFEGENAFGGTISAPMITAEKVEVTDYATAFAPVKKTIDVNKKIDQHGYVLKLEKIEIAEKETRAYVTITNNSKDTISFYSFNTKLITGGKQLEQTDDYNYPEIQSDILPGVTTEGIIAFPVIPESGDLKVYMEGSSENYDITIEPFQFDITY